MRANKESGLHRATRGSGRYSLARLKAGPAFRIYSVTKDGVKSNWFEIGAAWKHGDGRGHATSTPLE